MERGYVKLWRKSLDSEIMQNQNLFCVWMWCLLKASHKHHAHMVGFQKVDLEPGQFVFGFKAASKELRLSMQKIRTCIFALEINKQIIRKSTNKFSVITIVNWGTYQGDNIEDNKQTSKKQQTNNKQITTNKNEENEKNENISPLPPFLNADSWGEYQAHRKAIKKPMTPQAEKLAIKKLHELAGDSKGIQKQIIEQSIIQGWVGLFPFKNQNQNQQSGPYLKLAVAGDMSIFDNE